jgi:superoxide dismutase, Fe-Mn family
MSSHSAYHLPDLPYAYDSLEPVYSRELLELHHDKHHATYVKGANDALAKLAEMRKSGDFANVNQLEKDLAFNLSGHVLHSIFWRNMSAVGGGDPEGELAKAIGKAFGSVDAFRAHMTAAATSIQGSGWAALSWEPLSGGLVIEQIYDHQSNVGRGALPLLVLDMWEHAYYLQYQNEKKKWANAFWDIVNWRDVADRFAGVKSVDLRLAA